MAARRQVGYVACGGEVTVVGGVDLGTVDAGLAESIAVVRL